ncbi:MAG: hypothetical protein Sylvanvirus30_6 [Sylvanvirus sp.]|uniref:Uncharacterized protein n=1 Tax=Sylvanvirus sp. TaxID=2487774 RepID=A0A3G5AJV2_9VIRU|nr:MAG: hypothetical protein Sylvanvirus30_6 [Sylvanvirus sp.]
MNYRGMPSVLSGEEENEYRRWVASRRLETLTPPVVPPRNSIQPRGTLPIYTPSNEAKNEILRETASPGLEVLKQLLQQNGIDPNAMAQVLSSSTAAIAGSAAFWAALKGNDPLSPQAQWKPNDFDIWIPSDPTQWSEAVEAFHPLLIQSGYRKTNVHTPAQAQGDYRRLRKWVDKIYTYTKGPLSRRRMSLVGVNQEYQEPATTPENMSIQIMTVKNQGSATREQTLLNVIQSFDLQLCEYWWTGDDHIKSTNDQLPVSVLPGPGASQQTIFEWLRTFQRAIKYKGRGFTLEWVPFMLGAMKSASGFFQPNRSYSGRRTRRGGSFTVGFSNVLARMNEVVSTEGSSTLQFVFIDPDAASHVEIRMHHPDIPFNLLGIEDTQNGELAVNYVVNIGDLPNTGPQPIRGRHRSFLQGPQEPFVLPFSLPVERTLENTSSATYTLPSNWRTEAAERMTLNANQRVPIQQGHCFDFVNITEEVIELYLEEDRAQNLVLLSPPTSSGDVLANASCTTREQIQRWRSERTNVTLPCAGPEGRFPVDTNLQFVRIELREFPVHVPLVDVDAVLNNADQLYQVTATDLQIPTTASLDTVLGGSYVSADHCQAGSSKRIYRLHPVEFVNEQGTGRIPSSSNSNTPTIPYIPSLSSTVPLSNPVLNTNSFLTPSPSPASSPVVVLPPSSRSRNRNRSRSRLRSNSRSRQFRW